MCLLLAPGESGAGYQTPSSISGIAGTFSIAARADGSKQLTYDGSPVYTWTKDKKPGDMTGQGVAGTWWILAAPVAATSTTTPANLPTSTPVPPTPTLVPPTATSVPPHVDARAASRDAGSCYRDTGSCDSHGSAAHGDAGPAHGHPDPTGRNSDGHVRLQVLTGCYAETAGWSRFGDEVDSRRDFGG